MELNGTTPSLPGRGPERLGLNYLVTGSMARVSPMEDPGIPMTSTWSLPPTNPVFDEANGWTFSPTARSALRQWRMSSSRKWPIFREGGSEKHLRDIASVVRVPRATRLDRAYIEEWAGRLDLVDIWQSIISRVNDEPASDSR